MNLQLILDMAVGSFGNRVVLGRRDGGITAADLQRSAQGGADEIRERGADSLVFLAPNGPAFVLAIFAAAYAGVPMIPLNYRLGAEAINELLSRHPGALLVSEERRSTVATGNCLTPQQWVDTCAQRGADDLHAEEVPSNDAGDPTAVIIYTSGTTAAPKGVLLGHQNLMSYVIGTVEFGAAEENDAALVSLPPYHVAAVANALTNLYAGRRVVSLESFTPDEWIDTARAEAITNALIVPTMLSRLIDAERLDLPSLRTLSYGGAPMPTALLERALRRLPAVDFVNAYGLTETSSTITLLSPADHRTAVSSDDLAVRRRLGSVGTALPGVDIEIRDAHGQGVPNGVSGRIWVRGEQVSGRYAETGSVLDADGYFDTRDRGTVDDAGYLFIEGRDDDTIIRGGENIAPVEIEDALLCHEDVEDAVVVGVPDEEWGHRIEAMVVIRDGAVVDNGELREYVRSKLRSSKTPERITAVASIPRTDTGKLLRREVRRTLAEDH
ncbi:class I adenylate-forming enzyme family protein [Cumulibacter soli]|uniref:class I adenylate-forming enzyme family protein n=1 Tax=Cumulibacter soli TaxID=2546344 RepID=UPI0010678A59|nr:AMP-binding protein [Cumulibacter soli]